ncbi:hypothetical protein [Streptomyces sp. NBC_00470]|uniref:hypothetical protein n=1 Tax=Streptomyces sp. NBC_00470 TaxID=2975753 RepID=UPI002F906DCF
MDLITALLVTAVFILQTVAACTFIIANAVQDRPAPFKDLLRGRAPVQQRDDYRRLPVVYALSAVLLAGAAADSIIRSVPLAHTTVYATLAVFSAGVALAYAGKPRATSTEDTEAADDTAAPATPDTND